MTKKDLSDAGHRLAELRHEWQSFLGLLSVLDLRPLDPVLYQRCLTAVWRSRKCAISRMDLQQAVGLGFQAESLDFDLLLAQLVREEILEPITSNPFHFQIRRRTWTLPESAYAADDRLSLSATVREDQTVRFRKSVVEPGEAIELQLELTLDVNGNFDLEGEEHATSERGRPSPSTGDSLASVLGTIRRSAEAP